ncbi:hypothetical protein [Mesorhizobium sp. B2-4-3]|nr:hypothetical protein [Mesorhizobium sp. B2-4-3]
MFTALLTDRDPKGNGQPGNPDWPMHLVGAGTPKKKLPEVLPGGKISESF